MRNFVILTFLIVTATTVCAFYVPDENLTDDPGTDLQDAELDPEIQFNDGEPVILIRNKRARFDSFYGSSVDSGESRNNLYYQPLFRYRQTKKKRRRLFVPNLWG